MYQPTLLIIRDGWGANPDVEQDQFNAVKLARTPCDDQLRARYPVTKINASGLDVGLPHGIMGNSEVGHQNIGAGRIVDQELVRINKALEGSEIRQNGVFAEAVKHVREKGTTFHLMGIVSDAGVHGMLDHLYRLLELLKEEGITKVLIHAFTDGRDTSPTSGLAFIREVEAKCREIGVGRIATVSGRFWSMDRDNRWERVEKAYDCLIGMESSETAVNAEAAISRYYEKPLDSSRTGDEFVPPTRIVDVVGKPVGAIEDGDAVLFYNYRGDRPREITKAFVEEDFAGFDRGKKLDLFFVTMTEYETGLPVEVLFRKPAKMKNILGSYVSDQGIPQFRCAETEKYPHVTFFFNDYREDPFPLEKRSVAPSPKVATYDLRPEMSADAVMNATRDAILSKKYGLIVVNFANPDMVAHSGSLEATVQAVEKVDACVAVLLEALAKVGGKAVVTADHGNAEQLWDPKNNSPHTSHTLNQVELFVVGDGFENAKLRAGGRLADVAPTLLDLMGLPKPAAMTGESLIVR